MVTAPAGSPDSNMGTRTRVDRAAAANRFINHPPRGMGVHGCDGGGPVRGPASGYEKSGHSSTGRARFLGRGYPASPCRRMWNSLVIAAVFRSMAEAEQKVLSDSSMAWATFPGSRSPVSSKVRWIFV